MGAVYKLFLFTNFSSLRGSSVGCCSPGARRKVLRVAFACELVAALNDFKVDDPVHPEDSEQVICVAINLHLQYCSSSPVALLLLSL